MRRYEALHNCVRIWECFSFLFDVARWTPTNYTKTVNCVTVQDNCEYDLGTKRMKLLDNFACTRKGSIIRVCFCSFCNEWEEYHLRRLRRSTSPTAIFGCICDCKPAISLLSLGKLSWISSTSLGSGPGSGSGSPTTKLTGVSDISRIDHEQAGTISGTTSTLDPDEESEESDGSRSLGCPSACSMLPSKTHSRIRALRSIRVDYSFVRSLVWSYKIKYDYIFRADNLETAKWNKQQF